MQQGFSSDQWTPLTSCQCTWTALRSPLTVTTDQAPRLINLPVAPVDERVAFLKPLLLIGCGGHARSLIELVESAGIWKVQGLVGLPNKWGLVSLTTGDWLCGARTAQEIPGGSAAVGQLPDPKPKRLASQLDSLDFIIRFGFTNAVVSRHALLGQGCTVGHGVIVNASAEVGDHCILNGVHDRARCESWRTLPHQHWCDVIGGVRVLALHR